MPTTSSNDAKSHDAPRTERVTRAEGTAGEPDAKDSHTPDKLDADGQDPYDNIACTD